MTDDVIHCPHCGRETHFIRVDKYVRIFELSRDNEEKIHVIQCEICKYPISAYPDEILPDSND